MAITALVTQLSGQAWILGTDGSLTAIHQGSRIPEGAEVVAASAVVAHWHKMHGLRLSR